MTDREKMRPMTDDGPSIIDDLPALAAAGVELRLARFATALITTYTQAADQEAFHMKAACLGFSPTDADRYLAEIQGPRSGSSPTAEDRTNAMLRMGQDWRP